MKTDILVCLDMDSSESRIEMELCSIVVLFWFGFYLFFSFQVRNTKTQRPWLGLGHLAEQDAGRTREGLPRKLHQENYAFNSSVLTIKKCRHYD